MTREQLQQIRAIVYDAYCEGDTEAWWMLVVIDAALAAPEPQPDTWDGAEEWERLAFELCADEHGEESCNELIWSDNEPWGDRWLEYEDEAKRMISLVRKHTAPIPAPQREWVSLDSDDLLKLPSFDYDAPQFIAEKQFVQAVDAALKEKNHE